MNLFWRIGLLIVVLVVTAIGAGRETVKPSQVRVVGAPGTFELHVNGRPFYIRGVSFSINEGADDPREVLTPQRLRFHFTRIRQMGANTIRRYGERDDPAAIRDTETILDEAHRAGLKVLLGFWLGQDVDYVRDQARLNVYRQRIRQWVLRHKDHPAVLMWVIGNEVWGLLKGEFPDPEDLWPRRTAYYRFVNEVATMIHTLDGTRPVMTVDEHIDDEWGAHDAPWRWYGIRRSMEMFTKLAPAVDVFGINSYAPEDISVLQDIVRAVGLRTPYVVSEFGPRGYWLPHRLRDEIGQPIEPSDFDKTRAYLHNWRLYIEPYRGWNLGGNAFVWKDKHEGSFTWFGLTDSADRLKPSYWALREAWTGRLPPPHRPLVMEFSINKRWMRPGESFVVETRLLPMQDPETYLYTYLIAPVSMAYVETEFTTDLPRVALHAPGVPGIYRVYVYVKTRDNRLVSTGSTTFAVYEARAPAP